tara:strand:- start:124 stop:645 length:522 start_codon:yes stop_codon:yes gene_type:complete
MSNTTAKAGDKVSVHYVATFDDGKQFDSSYDRKQTIDIIIGEGKLLSGFETAIEGMEVGTKKLIHLEASEAYGEVDPNAKTELPKTTFPENFVENIQVGTVLPLSTKEFPDRAFPATATEVKEDTIVFDLNHPLAGKAVNFDIELVTVHHDEGEETTPSASEDSTEASEELDE